MNCLTHVSPGKIFTNNFAIFFFSTYLLVTFFQIEHGLSKEHPQSKEITMRLKITFQHRGVEPTTEGMHSEV